MDADTKRQVDELILMIEPSTDSLEKISLDFLPFLITASGDEDPYLAARATYLIGYIKDPSVKDLIHQAAKSPVPQVRMAAAAAARSVAENWTPEVASDLLMTLVQDSDISVRKIAIKSIPQDATPALRDRLNQQQSMEQSPVLKASIAKVIQQWLEIKER